jgi:hypothetical protein
MKFRNLIFLSMGFALFSSLAHAQVGSQDTQAGLLGQSNSLAVCCEPNASASPLSPNPSYSHLLPGTAQGSSTAPVISPSAPASGTDNK